MHRQLRAMEIPLLASCVRSCSSIPDHKTLHITEHITRLLCPSSKPGPRHPPLAGHDNNASIAAQQSSFTISFLRGVTECCLEYYCTGCGFSRPVTVFISSSDPIKSQCYEHSQLLPYPLNPVVEKTMPRLLLAIACWTYPHLRVKLQSVNAIES